MATAEEYAAWIVANKDKKGSPEFETVAKAYRLARGDGQDQDRPKLAPEDVPSFGETTLIGAGRMFDRVAKGMQQLYHGLRDNQDALSALKQKAEEEDRLYKPLQEARPWATGIGEALPSMVLPAGGSATLLGNVGRMAAAGGIPSALEYGSAEERLKRGALGAAGGAVAPVLGAGVKTGWSVIEPLLAKGRAAIVGRTLNRAAADGGADVAARLSGATELVPGSAPTAAQVAQSGGIAALERAAAAANPEAYTQRFMEQAAARKRALSGIAGDDAAMSAAESARSAAAGPLYAAAKQETAKLTPELEGALSLMPDEVMSKARKLAKLAGEPIKEGEDMTGRALHYVKLALDDAIGKRGEAALGATEKRLMMEARDKLLAAIEQQIPAYGQARSTFAELSKPINQMEVGRELLDMLAPALADHGALGRETAATFATALRNADQTAARATGFPGATLGNVMSPQQMATLNAIAQDLGRKATAQDLGRGAGSDTFQKLSMSNIANQSGMPRMGGLLMDIPGVSQGLKWAYRDTDQKMQGLLADALLDPAKAAELMDRANKKWLQDNPKTRRLLEQAVARGGGLLGMSSASISQGGN